MQLESEVEVAALVANITENSDQLEVSAVSVASTIIEDLTTAAINNPEVCMHATVLVKVQENQ